MELCKNECGYFPGTESEVDFRFLPEIGEVREFFPEDKVEIDDAELQKMLFSFFSRLGFRRAGNLIYNNFCPKCKKCRPIRIPTADFSPTKGQRRIFRMNGDITTKITRNPDELITEEKIDLYRKYSLKHNEKMHTREKAVEELLYWNGMDFIGRSPHYSGTANIDYYLGGKLVACSVIDELDDGFSSVYFYYDTSPQTMKRSLGTFSVIFEINMLKNLGSEYYYLGYYIAGHKNMDYKANFRPYELMSENGKWETEQTENGKLRTESE